MAEKLYYAKIEHTQHSIDELYKTQYYAFEKHKLLIQVGIGFALLVLALTTEMMTWLKALLLMAGALLIAFKDLSAQVRSGDAVEARGGALPVMHYGFCKTYFTVSGEGEMKIPYKKIARLVYDEQYLYLFMSKNSVCMLERSSVEPGEALDLMKFLMEKTDLKWKKEKSLLSMNLWDLRDMMKERRAKK